VFARVAPLSPTATAQSTYDVAPPYARYAKSLTLGSAKKLQLFNNDNNNNSLNNQN
jgi:hypothetical protein